MYSNANPRQPRSQPANSPPEQQPYQVTHDFDGTATLSETLIHAVSATANADVSTVQQALVRELDPTSLDLLFRSQGQSQSLSYISLTILGENVTIYSNGQIVIAPPARL